VKHVGASPVEAVADKPWRVGGAVLVVMSRQARGSVAGREARLSTVRCLVLRTTRSLGSFGTQQAS
jgi:hypothetical protein